MAAANYRRPVPGRPPVDSIGAVTVEFDRPLDRALLEHSLNVTDPAGRPIDGQATIADGETAWSFVPRHPWRAHPYRVLVDARLEDLAGNSLTRVFDRDLLRPEDSPRPVQRGVVTFQPRRVDTAAPASPPDPAGS